MTTPTSNQSVPPHPTPSKQQLQIYDALVNLENELNAATALNSVLFDKAHYFMELCEDAGKVLGYAHKERQKLKEALKPLTATYDNRA